MACITETARGRDLGGIWVPTAVGAGHRPLTFEEFEHRMNQMIYVSATPGRGS